MISRSVRGIAMRHTIFLRNLTRKFLHFPRFLHRQFFLRYNRVCLRLSVGGGNLGKRAKVFNRIYLDIHPQSYVRIGDDFTFTSGESINPLCRTQRGCIVAERAETVIEIGHHVGMASPCLWAKERITIGNYVNIGGDCIIMDSDAHNLDWRVRDSGEMFAPMVSMDNHTAKCAPIVIKDHVLIGAKSIILKGVTIGEGSVIGAGSVVVKDIPANCIAAGNPCKVIKRME